MASRAWDGARATAAEAAAELAVYRRLAGARVRGQMQYKASFWLQLAGNTAIHVFEFAAVLIFFRNFDDLGGWRVGDIAFLYGVSSVSFGIAHVVAGGFATFAQQILRGEFDRVLTRPMGSLLQVLAHDVQLQRLGGVLQGFGAFAVAARLGDVPWDVGRALYLPVVLASAATLFVALFALEATLCFWTTQATEVVNAFTYGGSVIAVYPIHIFEVWLRRLFLFVVPLGFVTYAPALYVLAKPDPLGLPGWSRFVAPLVAAAFAAAAGAAWQAGVRHYRSTGT